MINVADILRGLTNEDLIPRYHHGVGFGQLYITEHIRLHVWHPDFSTEPEAFGCRHNHRFDMHSKVLLGAVTNIILEPQNENAGKFRLYDVKPAHFGHTPMPTLADSEYYSLMISDAYIVSAGDEYQMRRRVFHEGRGHGKTITLVTKSNQSDRWAQIVARVDQTPTHGMTCKINPIFLRDCFIDALAYLDKDFVLIHDEKKAT